MNTFWIIMSLLLYLGILFGVAYYAEHRAKNGSSLLNSPYIYALSLAVYCTAWTYYGSVGRAATEGPSFLPTYLGPLILMPIWWIILRKIIRISKLQRLSSIADFISARYGKSTSLGVLTTLVCVLVIIPYISLQLKAISTSFLYLSSHTPLIQEPTLVQDIAFYLSIFLAAFTILFGTRSIEAIERHEGLVTAVAFESVVKLVAFLAGGLFVTYLVFEGFEDIFNQAEQHPIWQNLFFISSTERLDGWTWQILIAFLTILFLPRQFQVAVVENVNENHLRKALWIFPLYLLLINIFVLPIALGGNLLFEGKSVDADSYVLAIPLLFDQDALALFIFIGGFSAATGMIIVETTTLSVMLSNNVVLPLVVSRSGWKDQLATRSGQFVLLIRRIAIGLVLLLAYLYYATVTEGYSLVSIGIVSFVGVAQFAPLMLGGLYWKRANKRGALLGLCGGVLVWLYTLVLPSLAMAGYVSDSIIQQGPWGIGWLNPYALLGLTGMDPAAHALFWSMLVNLALYTWGALVFEQNALEHTQALLFVDIFTYSKIHTGTTVWQGQALITDIASLLSTFLGPERAKRLIAYLSKRHNFDPQSQYADPRLVTYAEQLLAGAVGTASARIMVASVTKDERISVEEVVSILKESQELMSLNRELRRTSEELRQTTQELSLANERLRQADKLRDDFLSTVTHEIRTPLTSIRAFSEILYDNPDMTEHERNHFLNTIIKESERLTRLINQVLDLERYDSGRAQLSQEVCDMAEIIYFATTSLSHLAEEKGIQIKLSMPQDTLTFMGDYDRMIQVMINLLSNAIKFCAPQTGLITLTCTSLDDHIRVSVQDNGPGIAPQYQALIFEKFYQANVQNKRKPIGSGLGLAISKRIIELHGGTIGLTSEAGQGACFAFTIPHQITSSL